MKNRTDKTTPKKRKANRKTYLDVLLNQSRFVTLRYKRDFTDLMTGNLVAEAANKCLEIKTKYNFIGATIKPELAVDIALTEKLYIDVETENSNNFQDSWLSINEDKDSYSVLWINPKLKLKEGQEFLLYGLSRFLCREYSDLFVTNRDVPMELEELVKYPELLRATILEEVLFAMLLSNETKAELEALKKLSGVPVREPKKQVLDLSTYPENLNISAEGLSTIVNGNLSKECQDVLHQWCANHSEVKND